MAYVPTQTHKVTIPEGKWMEGSTYSKKKWLLILSLFSPFFVMIIFAFLMIFVSIMMGIPPTELPFLTLILISVILTLPVSYFIFKFTYKYKVLLTRITGENNLTDNKAFTFEMKIDSLLSMYDHDKKVSKIQDIRKATYSFSDSTFKIKLFNSLDVENDPKVEIILEIKSPEDEEFMMKIKNILEKEYSISKETIPSPLP